MWEYDSWRWVLLPRGEPDTQGVFAAHAMLWVNVCLCCRCCVDVGVPFTPQRLEAQLLQAARAGDLHQLSTLLALPHLDVNATDASTGHTALHISLNKGHTQALTWYLRPTTAASELTMRRQPAR